MPAMAQETTSQTEHEILRTLRREVSGAGPPIGVPSLREPHGHCEHHPVQAPKRPPPHRVRDQPKRAASEPQDGNGSEQAHGIGR